jgi:hypothetical protein
VCDEASEEKIRNYKSQQNEKESVNENMCAPLLELSFGLGFRNVRPKKPDTRQKEKAPVRPRRVTSPATLSLEVISTPATPWLPSSTS